MPNIQTYFGKNLTSKEDVQKKGSFHKHYDISNKHSFPEVISVTAVCCPSRLLCSCKDVFACINMKVMMENSFYRHVVILHVLFQNCFIYSTTVSWTLFLTHTERFASFFFTTAVHPLCQFTMLHFIISVLIETYIISEFITVRNIIMKISVYVCLCT